MLKVQGTTLYPQMVFSILDDMPSVNEYYVIVEAENEMSDKITVYVSLQNENSEDAEIIETALQAQLRVKPGVVIIDDEAAQKKVYVKGSRKPVRFIDRRKQDVQL